MLVVLVALPARAQMYDLDDQPFVSFYSTSIMMPVGSAYSSNPMLDIDGYAGYAEEPFSPVRASGPRRIGPDINSELDENDRVPVGDAVIPLSLLALAFCGVICLRRRKNVSA